MKIFDSDVIKDIDRATCEAQKIDSVELMERAAGAVSCEIISRFLPSQRIVVIAGPGNNGGDALAVARWRCFCLMCTTSCRMTAKSSATALSVWTRLILPR